MSINGIYSIIDMEKWDEDVLQMDGPAFIEITDRSGRLHSVCVDGLLDVESSDDRIMFSWSGSDDGRPVGGAGFARLEGGVMKGRLWLHRGEHSDFTAVRGGISHKAKRKTV